MIRNRGGREAISAWVNVVVRLSAQRFVGVMIGPCHFVLVICYFAPATSSIAIARVPRFWPLIFEYSVSAWATTWSML